MPQVCINTNLTSGTWKQVCCHNTHNHVLKLMENGMMNLSDKNTPYEVCRETNVNWPGRWRIDPRYAGVDEVGTKLVINQLVPPLFIEGNSHSYNWSIFVFARATVLY